MGDVICPSCKGRYHRTTKEYAQGKPINGAMFKANIICKKLMLWTFPEFHYIKTGDIECPNCGTLYEQQGHIIIEDRVGNVKASKARPIPEEMNEIIWNMRKNKKRVDTIAKAVGFSRQAVTTRLYDLKREKYGQDTEQSTKKRK